MNKKRGLAALKETDPQRFAEIQKSGQQAAKIKNNYGWTAERRAERSKAMKDFWKNKDADKTLQR